VIYGVAYDETLGDRVKVTILAAGFEMENLAPKSGNEAAKAVASKGLGAGKQQVGAPAADSAQIDVIAGQYGQDKVADARIQKARNLYVVLNPSQFDSDAVIERLEKYPAFNRTKEEKRSITELTVNAPAPSVAAAANGGGRGHNDSSSQIIDFTLE
jgi:cell division protein FtsZ